MGFNLRLEEFLKYDKIVIQCHDNPDADAIASGYALYTYFNEHGKDVRFIYRGRFTIKKSNLLLMIQELRIPIEYVPDYNKVVDILIVVDCQYNEGNITGIRAKKVAVIDHHQPSSCDKPDAFEIRSSVGSCSTIVWSMLESEGYNVNKNQKLATALYYGLYTDTNAFTELQHPLDKDLRDRIKYDKKLITKMKNSNFTLSELKIAGMAMLGSEYHEEHKYAILDTAPCDPNILGMISDFFLEADSVEVCLVYSVIPSGVKFSVRSCVDKTDAGELAEYLAEGIGSGGGRSDKAGGFIKKEQLKRAYERYAKADTDRRDLVVGDIMRSRMRAYFDEFEIIKPNRDGNYILDGAPLYQRSDIPLGIVLPTDLYEEGTLATIRTLNGDTEVVISSKMMFLIGNQGTVYIISREYSENEFIPADSKFTFDFEYVPNIRDNESGHTKSLLSHARACRFKEGTLFYIKKIDHFTRIYLGKDSDSYLRGRPGEYLIMFGNNKKNINIITAQYLKKYYKKITTR